MWQQEVEEKGGKNIFGPLIKSINVYFQPISYAKNM